MNMKVQASLEINSDPANTFEDLVTYAGAVASSEGRDLFRHIAKMTTAVGDLVASADLGDKLPRQDIYDEVATLVVRATVFGTAFGMGADDLKEAIGRVAGDIVGEAVQKRLDSAMSKAGFGNDNSPVASVLGAHDAATVLRSILSGLRSQGEAGKSEMKVGEAKATEQGY